MPIAFDAGTRLSLGSSATHTKAHTITGENPYLVVSFQVGGGITCSGVTWNGTAMAQVVDYQMTNHSNNHMYFYVLGAAETGTHNVVISLSAATGLDAAINSFTGAQAESTADSTNTATSASSSSFTFSTTTVADNCWLVGQVKDDRGDAVAGTNTTGRAGSGTGAGDTSWSTSTDQTPPGSKSLQVTWGGATPVDTAIISFAPVTVAAPNNGSFLTLF